MDFPKKLTLKWSELISASEIENYNNSESGIYIWGFDIEEVFIPYYLGIADNVVFRIYEHLNLLIGGKYTIFHKDSLVNFKEFKAKEVDNSLTKGKIYSPNWPKEYQVFLDNRNSFNPILISWLKLLHLHMPRLIITYSQNKILEKLKKHA